MNENHKKFLEELNRLQREHNISIVLDYISVRLAIGNYNGKELIIEDSEVFADGEEWSYIQ